MNRYQDIDEGYATYDEERERATLEAVFINKPNQFRMNSDGIDFQPIRIANLHIQGKPRPLPICSFDFEEGFADVLGTANGEMGHLEIRWSDYGRQRDLRFIPATR